MLSLNRRFKGVPDPVGLARSIAAVLADIPDNTMREALRELIHRRIRKFSVRAMTDPGEQAKRRRIYMMVEDASNVKNLLPSLVSNEASPESWYASNVTPIRKNPRGGLSKSVLEGTYFRGKKVVDSIEHLDLEIKRMWDDECLGYMLGFRSVALEYYFYPVKREVLKATIMNMEQFLLYRDVFDVALQSCYRCGGQGAASSETTLKMACHNCWDVESDGKGLPRDLLMFGPPLH
jgi:hypothetical protein